MRLLLGVRPRNFPESVKRGDEKARRYASGRETVPARVELGDLWSTNCARSNSGLGQAWERLGSGLARQAGQSASERRQQRSAAREKRTSQGPSPRTGVRIRARGLRREQSGFQRQGARRQGAVRRPEAGDGSAGKV